MSVIYHNCYCAGCQQSTQDEWCPRCQTGIWVSCDIEYKDHVGDYGDDREDD